MTAVSGMLSPSSNSTIMRRDLLSSHRNFHGTNVQKFIKDHSLGARRFHGGKYQVEPNVNSEADLVQTKGISAVSFKVNKRDVTDTINSKRGENLASAFSSKTTTTSGNAQLRLRKY